MEKIANHSTAAKARLLQQYKGNFRMEALIDALFGQQTQDIEDAGFSLYGRLDIDNSVGAQLDRIGGIVGLARRGWSDTLYRILLKAKAGQNTSYGTIEDVISVWQLLAQANQVQVVETYPAQVDLYSDTPIHEEIAAFVRDLMQKVVVAGVQVDFLAIIYSATNAFGFDGDNPNISGFGDLSDPNSGGEFAYIQLIS